MRSGRLRDPSSAPVTGETFEELYAGDGVIIEQILSGATEPAAYDPVQDEWVVVLAGAASLDVGGVPVELGPQDWVLLPAGVPHRVMHIEPGTSWLAVHVSPGRR